MPNLLDDIQAGSVPSLDLLHTEICRAVEEASGDDEAKRLAIKGQLIECIAEALSGDCGLPLVYDPDIIADYVTGYRPPGM